MAEPRPALGLELVGLSKSFARTPVLRGVDLKVADGELLAVVGPSGCGKSTLLRIVAGLEEQDAGEVRIGGAAVDALAPKERDVAMVFQSYALYPHMTVGQNIALPLVMRDLSRTERLPLARTLSRRVAGKRARIHAAVESAAKLVDLQALLDRKPGQLSGGQRQRVALARALVRQPRLFLLDEPLSNLDAALRASTRTEIVELQQSLAVTTIYVTHDQAEAMTMASRIAVMMDGEIVQIGTAKEIYDHPVDDRVALFIGTPGMNLLAGEVAGGLVHLPGGSAPLGRCAGIADGPVRIGVRPEHVALEAPARGSGLRGRLRHVEFLGAEALVHLRLAEAGPEMRLIARVGPDRAAALGVEEVGLRFAGHALHLFDGAGRRHRIEALEAPPALGLAPLGAAR